ncbi:pilus assembly protein TadG-related protein [Magnetospirillum fulvum]|uniref:Putative Flp pilus assembly protein TadG n=1 Tax=Magnetospirillum fulvum MGU-K5 TaxID=1316936 RepID=S9TFV1_MAGFU|nr:pilus assembly protein TadG-related protein [Magnetospirillum fulvum]EPY01121.1 putative Flp pilus assembly protein TadG [Magnetospirillum fulvum MGU-K5]
MIDQGFGTRIHALASDRRGVAGIIVTVCIATMVLLMMGGIDVVRAYLIKSRAQAAIDAAVLAAGHSLGSADCKAQGEAYFSANMGSNYLGSSISQSLTFVVDGTKVTADNAAKVCSVTKATGDIITATASLSLPLLSLGFIPLSNITFTVSNQAQRTTNSNLELVLAMDNTGSMNDYGKLQAMKNAATNMVNSLFGNNSTGAKIYVGLVPFTETVRAGKDSSGTVHSGWVGSGGLKHFNSISDWNGCFFERSSGNVYSLNAAPPTTAPFEDWASFYYRWSYTVSCSWGWCQRNSTPAWSTSNPYFASSKKNDPGCSNLARVTFLSSNQQNILNNIKAMVGNGSTMISSGVLWAWRMLDPGWRNSSAADGWGNAALPQDSATTLTKAIVLLTDGNNAPSYTNTGESGSTGWSGVYLVTDDYYMAGAFKGAPKDVNGSPTDGNGNVRYSVRYGQDSGDIYINDDYRRITSTAAADDILIQACTNAKAAGITIFTIALNTNGAVSSGTQNLLTQCASNSGYYYNVSNVSDLNGVFSTISGRLSELKLVK